MQQSMSRVITYSFQELNRSDPAISFLDGALGAERLAHRDSFLALSRAGGCAVASGCFIGDAVAARDRAQGAADVVVNVIVEIRK
jgi:hypothetical protein